MEKNSYSEEVAYPLAYKNIDYYADEIDDYIDGRRKYKYKPLKTRWSKLNRILGGGLESNSVYTISGISGSGKSSFANSLESDLFDTNPDIDFVVLSFSYEMLSSKNVGRKLSYKLKKTTSELYSGGDNPLDDKEYNKIQSELKNIKQLPIYYVETPGTVSQIRETILRFMEKEGKNKWIIIVLDHTLLVRRSRGEDERIMLSNLQRMFIEVKKYGKNTIIQLTQMNRNIESVDRIANNSMHYPMRTDLSSSDSIFHASDVIMILHAPEKLGISSYGPRHRPTEGLVYLHISKNRDGEAGVILQFENNLKYNRLDESIRTDEEKSQEIKLNL
jgi:replicative DNA helicase